MYELIPFVGLEPVRWSEPRLGRWVERFFGDLWPEVASEERGFVPSVDIKETPEAYEVVAEVPGLKPEDIHVEISGDLLIIKGEKRQEREEEKGEYHLVERECGSFYRGFRLPEPIERAGLSAEHKDGVLRVHLPKHRESPPVKVEVKPS